MTQRNDSDRCASCGVSKQQVLTHHQEQMDAMIAARDLCKQQTADVEELRQWQVQHAQVALQAIVAHGRSGVWTAEDCATQAEAALERMSAPVGHGCSPGKAVVRRARNEPNVPQERRAS